MGISEAGTTAFHSAGPRSLGIYVRDYSGRERYSSRFWWTTGKPKEERAIRSFDPELVSLTEAVVDRVCPVEVLFDFVRDRCHREQFLTWNQCYGQRDGVIPGEKTWTEFLAVIEETAVWLAKKGVRV